jgi:predicted nucleic acid-binding protein
MNAVDTNVLVYSLDDSEPIKQAKARQLIRKLTADPDPTYLLWQVLGEFAQRLRRWMDLGQLTQAEFEIHIQATRGLFPLLLPSAPVLDHALDLAKRYSLSHWDSMILGACQAAAITVLHTEDMGAPRRIDGIELLNPFQ